MAEIPHKLGPREKLFFFISGVIISIPLSIFTEVYASQLCFMLPMPFASLCSIALLTPFIEEFAKAYPLLYRHGETERSISTLGLLVGLGFGISEFLVYVLLLGVPFYIRLWGVFFHASTTVIMTFGIAKKRTWVFYLIAVSLHSAVNFVALLGGSWGVIGATAIEVVSYLLAGRLYTRTREKSFG